MRLDNDWKLEIPEDARERFSLHVGDRFELDIIEGQPAIVRVDSAKAIEANGGQNANAAAFRAAIARVDEAIRSGETDPEGTLPPISPAEEAAIERYERISSTFEKLQSS